MAERIVDDLEVVEIEEQQRHPLASRGAGEGKMHSLGQEMAVGKRRQRIVARHVGRLAICLSPLGDVDCRDQKRILSYVDERTNIDFDFQRTSVAAIVREELR